MNNADIAQRVRDQLESEGYTLISNVSRGRRIGNTSHSLIPQSDLEIKTDWEVRFQESKILITDAYTKEGEPLPQMRAVYKRDLV